LLGREPGNHSHKTHTETLSLSLTHTHEYTRTLAFAPPASSSLKTSVWLPDGLMATALAPVSSSGSVDACTHLCVCMCAYVCVDCIVEAGV
jgi:hypothetical protein